MTNLPKFTIIETTYPLSDDTLSASNLAKFGTYVTDSDFYSACLDLYNNGTDYTWEAPYWVQPTMTANTTTTTDGDYTLSANYSTNNPVYYCMDNSTSTYWATNQAYQSTYITYSLPINICVDKVQFVYNNNTTSYQYCYASHTITSTPVATNIIAERLWGTTGSVTINIEKYNKSNQFRFYLNDLNYTNIPRLTQINITPYINKITGKETTDGLFFYDVSENVTFTDIANTSVTQTVLQSVQDFEDRWGESNFYGIDTANQRILLPKKATIDGVYRYLKIK